MRPNDVIKEVDGISLYGMSLEEAVTYIKGEKGTSVELTIYRPSTEETLMLTIIRDEITEETVYYEELDNEMGYIRLTGFQAITDEQFDEALNALEDDGIDGIIIDLRNNPGGSLDTVINIVDRLLGEALIVYTEDKYGERHEYFSDEDESYDKPIVVLVNEYSASASEILAGAIKDLGVGTLVGNTTYGKGLVQNIIPLEDGSAVKVTIARYYTPSGNYINGVGIEADVQLVLENEEPYFFDTEKDEDLQLQLAFEVLEAAIEQ
jgi:carboxyl-terminal processing protease